MAIVERKEMPYRPIEIDLKGPNGNIFQILRLAQDIYKRQGRPKSDFDVLFEHVSQYCDYEMAVELIDQEIGDFVIFYK